MDGESEKRGHELLEDGGLMSINMLRVKYWCLIEFHSLVAVMERLLGLAV